MHSTSASCPAAPACRPRQHQRRRRQHPSLQGLQQQQQQWSFRWRSSWRACPWMMMAESLWQQPLALPPPSQSQSQAASLAAAQ